MRRLAAALALCASAACDPGPPAEPTVKFAVSGAYVVRPVGSAPAAFYATIANRSGDADQLVGLASHAFSDGSLHRTVDGRMEPVAEADIPARGALALTPGGLHGMLERTGGAARARRHRDGVAAVRPCEPDGVARRGDRPGRGGRAAAPALTPMQWWCAATGQAWTWTWRWYPGVWAVVAAVAAAVWLLRAPGDTPAARRDRRWGAAGVAVLWVALDWPVGPLGAGYLASVHALQFLLIAFVAAPLLVIGVRQGVAARARPGTRAEAAIGALTRPLPSVVLFNLLVVATHVPRVVDAWMPTQWGAFAIDLAWLAAGTFLWWPLLAEVPPRPRFAPPLRMLYLFLGTLVHTAMAIVMIVRDLPMYAVYELAPPVAPWSAMDDLRIAGGVMELAGAAIIFGILSRMFFAWARESA